MGFFIYFDESGKIDQPHKKNSYYGAFGGEDNSIDDIVHNVKQICRELGTRSELHFTEYTHDQYFPKYFRILDYVINQNIGINILIVDNKNAQRVAEQMEISLTEMRSLFYVKIPERLFYGMTRKIKGSQTVDIFVDRNDEYSKLRLYSKLKDQMNAHSAYRSKSYRIENVRAKESHKSIPLQIIDTFMGMVVFILEKKYEKNSNNSLIKSDLIYRFLIQNNNLVHFQEQITLFEWTGNEDLRTIPISRYISEFFRYKVDLDLKEMIRLNKYIAQEPGISLKQLREKMLYPNTMRNVLSGYKTQILGKGRNTLSLEHRCRKN